jgi:phenylacetate-CoA ligase
MFTFFGSAVSAAPGRRAVSKSEGFDVDANERLLEHDLRELQLSRMQSSLTRAYANNSAYRAKFDEARVRPEDLRTLDDLGRFPFTTKDDLRAAYPFGFFSVPREQVIRIHASSGTTGKPTVVGYTKQDIATWSALVARSIKAAGGKPGMKVHVAYGYGLFTGGLGAHYGAEQLGCTVIPMSGGQTERQVQLIVDFEPDIIMVTPSYMLCLLDEFRARGIDPRSSSLKIGIFGAEPWTHAMRQEIEESFDLSATDIYGLSEVMGPGVAQEYESTKDGPTIWEDHFYPEVIDPLTGEVLPDGEEGELVFTSLTKEAMPVVRYRTRDLTRLLPGSVGAMRRMAKITGRADDMLIIRGVNVFPSQIEEQILKCRDLSPHYLLEVTRGSRLDELTVHVELRPGTTGSQSVDGLSRHIKENIGVTAAIQLCSPGTLNRSAGKATRIRDLR